MIKFTKTMIGLMAGLIFAFLSVILPVSTTSETNMNPSCMTQNDVHTITLFAIKEPKNLPLNYTFQCGVANIHEAYLLYGSQSLVKNGSVKPLYEQNMSKDSIYLSMSDEKGILGDARFAAEFGNTSKIITDEYGYINKKNPSLHPELIKVNGITAWANEACLGCGKQIAYFKDGTILHHSFNVPARIQFFDDSGIIYTLQSYMPLDELKQVAESLR